MISALVYLKTQLGMSLMEWNLLDPATKEWYRQAAIAEQEFIAAQ